MLTSQSPSSLLRRAFSLYATLNPTTSSVDQGSGDEAQAQIEAFDDTWTWSQDAEALYLTLLQGAAPNRVKDALEAMRRLLGDNDVLAYLVMMTARLLELHRVLKSTGSLYLHCDPTASHYLKVVLDSIFGPEMFRNEVVWNRTAAKGLSTTRLANNHDILLGYARSPLSTWNKDAAFTPYDVEALDDKTLSKYKYKDPDGRIYRLSDITNPNPDRPNLTYKFMGMTKVWRWTEARMKKAVEDGIVIQTAPGRIPQMKRYLDEQRGRPLSDVWTDISPLNSQAAERLGYPTQKPLKLLERLITLTTSPGDIVLDPFCGCGTTVDAAQKLGRRWIGIDVTTLAVDLIDARLRHTYGEQIRDTYEILGIPQDIEGARHLFERSPFEFERWCVMALDGQPNEKQVGDKGIDGVIRIVIGARDQSDRVLISVKGGGTNPGHVQALLGTVLGNNAAMGVFATMRPPTKAMREVANTSGVYKHPGDGREYPRIQIVTVEEMLDGRRPKLPPTLLPYFQARRRAAGESQLMLDSE